MGLEKINMKISSSFITANFTNQCPETKSRERRDHATVYRPYKEPFEGTIEIPLSDDSNCAERIESTPPAYGVNPTFESSVAADGLSGQVKLSDYQNNLECMHEIVAAENCQAIVVEYESVAVEACGQGCACDQFRFGWSNGSEELQTPANCHCNNDASCDATYIYREYQEFNDGYFEYMSLGSYEWNYPDKYGDWMQPSDGFSVNANKFKFYFHSNDDYYGGHVHFNWRCVDDEVTTQPLTTTAVITTVTTTTTTTTVPPPPKLPELNPGNPDSCFSAHYGFDEFGDAVKAAIGRGLWNDILSYTRRPGVITRAAENRHDQWWDWFSDNFRDWRWSVSFPNSSRKCLTDKFPRDLPGDYDKSILGSDCALDLTSIDAICEHLPKFMDWAFDGCQSNARTRQLIKRCYNLRRIKSDIQSNQVTGDIQRKEGKGPKIGHKKHKPKRSKKKRTGGH